ncbi:MAG: universal stress protein [Bacillota bacterium]|nr:universal stress protein [Bacillota bacterium]
MARRILVPVDGSENALRAADFAAGLAESSPGTEVTLLHVCSGPEACAMPGRANWFSREKWEVEIRAHAEAILRRAERPFKARNLTPVTLIKVGDPARTIVEIAGEEGYNQIVMGSRGLSNVKGLVLGSVSHKVISLSGVPVTIVK